MDAPSPRPLTLLDRAQHAQRRHVRDRTGPVEQTAPPIRSLPRDVNAGQQLVELVISRRRHDICIAHTYLPGRPDRRCSAAPRVVDTPLCLPRPAKSVQLSDMGSDGLLVPGETCWRVERADQFAYIIDGADYFRHCKAALLRAERRRTADRVGLRHQDDLRTRRQDASRPEPAGHLPSLAGAGPAEPGCLLAEVEPAPSPGLRRALG